MRELLFKELEIQVGETIEVIIQKLKNKDFLEKISNRIGKTIADIKYVLKDIDLDTLKILWNYSEKNTNECTFDELLNWIKENIPSDIKRACIYKKELSSKNIQLQVCFIDKNNEPLLNGEYSHLTVNAFSIDSKLKDSFGDKDMIVLG